MYWLHYFSIFSLLWLARNYNYEATWEDFSFKKLFENLKNIYKSATYELFAILLDRRKEIPSVYQVFNFSNYITILKLSNNYIRRFVRNRIDQSLKTKKNQVFGDYNMKKIALSYFWKPIILFYKSSAKGSYTIGLWQ